MANPLLTVQRQSGKPAVLNAELCSLQQVPENAGSSSVHLLPGLSFEAKNREGVKTAAACAAEDPLEPREAHGGQTPYTQAPGLPPEDMNMIGQGDAHAMMLTNDASGGTCVQVMKVSLR